MIPANYLKIDGVIMPNPDEELPITEYDLDSADTGRPESGFLHRERVRQNLGNYQMTFTKRSAEEIARIRNAVAPASISVSVWFLGQYITRTMYAGDRTYQQKFTEDGKELCTMSFTLSEY